MTLRWTVGLATGPLADDVRLAAEAAVAGGAAVLSCYAEGPVQAEDPTGAGPVTAADRASHRQITQLVRRNRPGDALLSEEGAPIGPGGAGGRLWIVDPLDGTKEFLARNGEFSVMVGLAIEGRAVLGAVYRPLVELLYLGLTEGPAWRIERPAGDATVAPLSLAAASRPGLRLLRSRSHADERLSRLESRLRPAETILSGSVGTKCALIAEGRAELYVHPVPHLKEWDTCAPEAVLRGAGGRVTDCYGRALSYGKADPRQPGGIFAASPDVWERVASHVHEVAPAPPEIDTRIPISQPEETIR